MRDNNTMRFSIKSLNWAISFILFITVLFGCSLFQKPHYKMHSITGKVIDIETKQPIDGVVILAVYKEGYNSIAGSGEFDVDAQETMSNSRGEFSLPERTVYNKGNYGRLNSCVYCLKANYFPEVINESQPGTIQLRKITHYLHLKKAPEFYVNAPSEYLNKSIGYNNWLNSIRSAKFTKITDAGVFLKDPTRKFTKLYWQENYYTEDSAIGGNFINAYDDNKQEWVTLDCSGKNAPVAQLNMPNWEYTISSSSGYPPIFARNNMILVSPTKYDRKRKAYNKVAQIMAVEGNISAITGDYDQFYTIEGNGKFFCRYILKPGYIPHWERSYSKRRITTADIFHSNEDSSGLLPTLKYLSTIHLTSGPDTIVCTKSSTQWRIYLFGGSNGNKYIFHPILVFPAEKEITSVATSETDNTIFIAFRNDGIRKYNANKKKNMPYRNEIFVEDTTFFANSRKVDYPEVVSMAYGYNNLIGRVLYVTTNSGIVYRFASDGTPDYMVKLEDN